MCMNIGEKQGKKEWDYITRGTLDIKFSKPFQLLLISKLNAWGSSSASIALAIPHKHLKASHVVQNLQVFTEEVPGKPPEEDSPF